MPRFVRRILTTAAIFQERETSWILIRCKGQTVLLDVILWLSGVHAGIVYGYTYLSADKWRFLLATYSCYFRASNLSLIMIKC